MESSACKAQAPEPRYELLNGKVILMSPRPAVNHARICGNIYHVFRTYLKGKKCEAFQDGVDVYLDEKNQVVPDAMIICNQNIIKQKNIQGTPDLIVEVLSPSTAVRDKGYKKNLYEKCGVKEYWIVSPSEKYIEVYLLKDGKFDLDNIYMVYPDYEIEDMRKESISIVTEFKTSICEDLTIKIQDIFEP